MTYGIKNKATVKTALACTKANPSRLSVNKMPWIILCFAVRSALKRWRNKLSVMGTKQNAIMFGYKGAVMSRPQGKTENDNAAIDPIYRIRWLLQNNSFRSK